MDLASAGLIEQPFRTHGNPILTVPYTAHREALRALRNVCSAPDGLAILQGPALAGKSTIVREFVRKLDAECAVAVVDGEDLNTTRLLESILHQIGYELDYNSANELFGMLRVFALQQAATHEAPLIIVENAHALRTSALRALAELAEIRVRQASGLRTSAIKMVLVADHAFRTLAPDEVLEPILSRTTADLHLRPMSEHETGYFLLQKLRKAGSATPEFIFPATVCRALHDASGGWPGILERLALLALAKATSPPVSLDLVERPALPSGTWDDDFEETTVLDEDAPLEAPRLVVTKAGKPVNTLSFDKPRLLVGRSEHNDISIGSRFVSRHHLLLVRNGSSTFLMDLNSTNGTLVNSRRVSNHVLMHEDVISIGHHRIKFYDPHATTRGSLDGAEFAETGIMKTLEDMRNLLEQENTEMLPAVSEPAPGHKA